MSKLVRNGDNYTETETGLVSSLFTVIGSMPKIATSAADDNTFCSQGDIAKGGLVTLLGGFVLGDMFGDKVPLIGGRREI